MDVCFLFILIVVFADEVYFSNLEDIRVLTNNETRVIFNDTHVLLVKALDCNVNDRRIYWINQVEEDGASGVIKRGFPDNSSAENVRLLRLLIQYLCMYFYVFIYKILQKKVKLIYIFCL